MHLLALVWCSRLMLHAPWSGGGGAAVQFMMGVVTTSGDAEIAHMLNSV